MLNFAKWWMSPKPWWHFWDPRSGFGGGLLFTVIGLIVLMVDTLT